MCSIIEHMFAVFFAFAAIVAIVLGSSVALGGVALIGWYCWKHAKSEQAVTPKPPPPAKPPAGRSRSDSFNKSDSGSGAQNAGR